MKSSPNSLPSDLNEVSDHLYALNDLQQKRDQPVDPSSLRFALRSLFLSLPKQVQSQISIPSATQSDALFGDNDLTLFRSLLSRHYAGEPGQQAGHEEQHSYWRKIRQREYFFWPVLADQRGWLTIIMRLESSCRSKEFDTVAAFAIVDSCSDPAAQRRITRVEQRIRELFACGNITFKSDAARKIWVPPQPEDSAWESGIRSFQLIRQLFQRITDNFCTHTPPSDDHLFNVPTSGWLNVDFIRHEMIGSNAHPLRVVLIPGSRGVLFSLGGSDFGTTILASLTSVVEVVQEQCNSALDFACRYALEPILEIRLQEEGTFPPNCLAPIDDRKST